jgi:hypothetical protein
LLVPSPHCSEAYKLQHCNFSERSEFPTLVELKTIQASPSATRKIGSKEGGLTYHTTWRDTVFSTVMATEMTLTSFNLTYLPILITPNPLPSLSVYVRLILMNQLKRWSSLQRKRFGYYRASVALDVWDSVIGHSNSMDRQIAVFQSLSRIRLPSCYDNTKTARTLSFICYRR